MQVPRSSLLVLLRAQWFWDLPCDLDAAVRSETPLKPCPCAASLVSYTEDQQAGPGPHPENLRNGQAVKSESLLDLASGSEPRCFFSRSSSLHSDRWLHMLLGFSMGKRPRSFCLAPGPIPRALVYGGFLGCLMASYLSNNRHLARRIRSCGERIGCH